VLDTSIASANQVCNISCDDLAVAAKIKNVEIKSKYIKKKKTKKYISIKKIRCYQKNNTKIRRFKNKKK